MGLFIEKEGAVYCALCLELDIATESDTLEGAKSNLREAVEGYIESAVRAGEERRIYSTTSAGRSDKRAPGRFYYGIRDCKIIKYKMRGREVCSELLWK